jgi:hypothetical protein
MTTGGVPLASDGIYLEENDMTGSRIKWLTNNRRLVALTGRTSWEDSGEMVTPATFDMRIVEYSGASGVQGLGNKDAIIYIDSSEKTLRALVFNAESQNAGFADTPLGPWANHILLAKVREFAVVNYPFPMAWLILQDGSLVSCTLDIRGGVAAFCRHPMNGFVESIQSGRDGGEDMLWLVVNHNGDRAIEHLIVREAAGQKFDESHYVDSGKRFMFTNATAHIEGLMHLAGREVSLFADGAPLPGKTVSNEGTLDLEYPVLKLHAGLPVRSLFEANTLETPANGTSLGNKRRVQSARLLLFESSGGAGGADEQHLEPLEYTRYGAYKAGSAPEPFTGTQELTVSGNIDSTGAFVLVHGEPVPFTLLALVERVAVIEV